MLTSYCLYKQEHETATMTTIDEATGHSLNEDIEVPSDVPKPLSKLQPMSNRVLNEISTSPNVKTSVQNLDIAKTLPVVSQKKILSTENVFLELALFASFIDRSKKS